MHIAEKRLAGANRNKRRNQKKEGKKMKHKNGKKEK